jgi:putative spermidine/putrescine transport system permease protein
MRSRSRRAPLALKLAALASILFLHMPLAIIILYAFTTDDSTFRFPLPGLTTRWFGVAWSRPDVWQALFLSVKVALVATLIAVVLGSLAAAAVHRTRFFGR